MTAHVLYKALDDELPATLSPAIITHLLREQMGYDGVVLTDDLEMHAIVDHYGPGRCSGAGVSRRVRRVVDLQGSRPGDRGVRSGGEGRCLRNDHTARWINP